MKKYWYIWLIALIAVATAAYLIFFRRKPLQFDFSLGGDLSTLLGLVSRTAERSGDKIGAYIDIPLTTTIANPNKIAAVLQNISGNISYNGDNVIQTIPGSAALQKVGITGKGSSTISDTVQLMINPSTIKLITDLIEGKKPSVTYSFSGSAMGRPVNFTNSTTINNQ